MTTVTGTPPGTISILPVDGISEIQAGDDINVLIADAIATSLGSLAHGDVVMVTHKVVSKAEGGLIDLATIEPSELAIRFASEWEKDPRHVEVVLQQSARIIRMVRGLIIAETRHGFICANAGVDASNVSPEVVCILPENPDASAEAIRQYLVQRFFPDHTAETSPIGVIITDSFGRPWRNGIVNIAIGVAGMAALADYRGQHDAGGYELRASVLAVADELASAAELVMHKLAARPVAIVRGFEPQTTETSGRGSDLVMPPERNLFI